MRVAIARLYEWCEDHHDRPWRRITMKIEWSDVSADEGWEYRVEES